MYFFFSSRRRHTRCSRDWSSDVCSSDLAAGGGRRFGRGGHALREGTLLVEPQAHAPLLAIADTGQHASHALEGAPHVVDGALVAGEEREELHGDDGSVTREVLDDTLVGDRAR